MPSHRRNPRAAAAFGERLLEGAPREHLALRARWEFPHAAPHAQIAARFADVERRFGQLIAEASERSVLLGRWIQVRTGASTIEGLVESLDADGQLLLRTADSVLRPLSVGEATVVAGR